MLSTKTTIFPKLENVEVISDDDINWQDIYRKQQPVLLKGINRKWPACLKWKDFHYLKEKVKKSSSNEPVIVPVEFGDHYMHESLEILYLDFIELLDFFDKKDNRSGPKLYLAQFDVNEIPGLVQDLQIPAITKTGSLYRTNIWLGGHTGSHSPCHYDPFNNILCQIYGQKKVILFPQSSNQYLYLHDSHHKQKNTSRIDFRNPDNDKFPNFKNAPSGLLATLEPTDALFIPLKWFHYCETKTSSCSVNYWFI